MMPRRAQSGPDHAAACSSGVPGVVAYLNGCNLPSTLKNWGAAVKTM